MASPEEAARPAPGGVDTTVSAGEEATLSRDEDRPGELPGIGAEESSWPAESVESAFLAEARGRGELPVAVPAKVETAEETDLRPLPALDDLVGRIPPEVRETLDGLFRAKFVRVARVPRNALK